MKLFRTISLSFIILFFITSAQAIDVPLNTTAKVFFSPHGGCTDAIIKEIQSAKSEIRVQAYSFTSKPIAEAIVKAKKKGINIEIVMDKSNRSAKYSAGDFTAHAGIPTYIDSEHAIAHSKIIIIDRETVITGSFNFTKAAEEKNAENLVILKSRELAAAYLKNYQEHREHSSEYKGK